MEKLVELYDRWHNSLPVNTVRLAGAGSNRAYYRLLMRKVIVLLVL